MDYASKEMKHRISEAFYSVQGEGKYTGTPSIFIRYVGCTLRCPGFSRPRSEGCKPNAEVLEIINNIDKYSKLEELPLVKTGCDSYPSTYPEFKRFCKEYTTEELADIIIGLLSKVSNPHNVHLVFTGGEPLLWQAKIQELIEFLDTHGYFIRHITFETNTTVAVKPEFDLDNHTVTFSMSPKLSISGEPIEKTLKPEVFQSIVAYNITHKNDYTNGDTYFKFVVDCEQDLQEIQQYLEAYKKAIGSFIFDAFPIYLMPVGGKKDDQVHFTEKQVAEICMKYGYIFCIRAHLHIFGNAWAT